MSQPSEAALRAEFIECLPYKSFNKLLAIIERPDREKAFSDAEHKQNIIRFRKRQVQAELYMVGLYCGMIRHYVAASAEEQQKLREGMLRQLNAGAEQGTITIGFKSGNSTYSMDQNIVYDPPSNLFSGSAFYEAFTREDGRTAYAFILPTNFGKTKLAYIEAVLTADFLDIFRKMYPAIIDVVVRPPQSAAVAAAAPAPA